MYILIPFKKLPRYFSAGPVVRTLLPLQREVVQYLVGELKPQGRGGGVQKKKYLLNTKSLLSEHLSG